MKNILIIHHGRGIGGGLIALIGLIEELKVNNHIEVLSVFDGIAVQYLRQTGVNVVIPKSKFYLKYYDLFVHSAAAYFDIIDCLKKAKSFIMYILSKCCFAKKELEGIGFNYDIVYLNSTFASDWALAAKRLNKKVIIHIREPLSRGILGIRRQILRNTINEYCDRIIAITRDNCNRVNLPNKTTIVYDPVVKKGRDELEKIEFDPSLKYFLYLGGMMRIKGFEQMVGSLDYLKENVRIYFLGDEVCYHSTGLKYKIRQILDPYLRKHQYLVQKLKTSPKIIYVGQTDKVFAFYRRSTALISPFSRPHASLPILEAFSLGLPVIVSNIMGMDELVNDRNGLFFKNNDPKSLANKINAMASLSQTEYDVMKIACLNTYKQIQERKETVSSVVERL